EPDLGPIDLVRPEEDVATPSFDQRTASPPAHPVGHPRPDQVADRAQEAHQEEVQVRGVAGNSGGEGGVCSSAAEEHRDFARDRDAGGLEDHEEEHGEVAVVLDGRPDEVLHAASQGTPRLTAGRAMDVETTWRFARQGLTGGVILMAYSVGPESLGSIDQPL